MTTYSEQPDIMAIGDSMYQGIRSLSFLPDMVRHSPPAQVARAIGMAMTVPDLQHPLLFDLEAELRRGGLIHLVSHIRDACAANLAHWPLDRPWSLHEAFDNIAVGGAQIASLTDDTYDKYMEQLPGLVAKLQGPGLPLSELAGVIGDLWYGLNNCYTLNPQHRRQQGRRAPLDQVEERQPRILLINIGSNEGLFMAGFAGDFSDETLHRVASIPEMLRPIADRLRRLPARTERIVFNRLIRPRFIPNLMPSPEHENDFPGDGYYDAYGPRISSTQQRITNAQLRAFDALIAQVNAEAEEVLRAAVGDRIAFADVYGACASVDGKHYMDRGLAVPGRSRVLTNKPITPIPFGFYGGLAGLDNMHPTVPGYAVIADAVLDALGNHQVRTDKAAAYAADTLLNNVRGLPFLIAEAELSLLGTFGSLGARRPAAAASPAVAAVMDSAPSAALGRIAAAEAASLTVPRVTWKGIVGKGFTPQEFTDYVATLSFAAWRPEFVVLHNTSAPRLSQWHSAPGAQRMRNLESYYRDKQGWSAGPHLFVADDLIWVFTPLTTSGVHSPSWNAVSWGVEMVGEYEEEPFSPDVRANAVEALAALHAWGGINPDGLRFHKEDPRTTHKTCPGHHVDKADIIARVHARMAAAHPGEHLPDRDLLVDV